MKTWICSGTGESASEGTSEGSDENSQNVSSVPLVSFLMYGQYLSEQEVTKTLSLFALACLFMKISLERYKDKIGASGLTPRLPKYNSHIIWYSSSNS